ncbi:MAG: hypothetical protein M3297_10915 [Thermoproteota archaeon]|jgi:hypothetical protein|nr:hypothetical protein [Thermoproteota archaeon]
MVKQGEKNIVEREQRFLKEVCDATLCVDKKVIFVGVVDKFGKLLVGGARIRMPKKKTKPSYNNIKPFSFYSCLLASGLKKWREEFQKIASSAFGSPGGHSDFHFEVLELDILKLAITPLTGTGELFLCIYFEPSAASQEVISKICKVI